MTLPDPGGYAGYTAAIMQDPMQGHQSAQLYPSIQGMIGDGGGVGIVTSGCIGHLSPALPRANVLIHAGNVAETPESEIKKTFSNIRERLQYHVDTWLSGIELPERFSNA